MKDERVKGEVMAEFCQSVPASVDCEPEFNAVVADAVVAYLRSHDYTNDAGEGIGDLLREKIDCANDPNCGPGAPDSVEAWIRLNYVDHMYDNQDTVDLRHAYFSALAEDIAHMTAYDIPEELLSQYTGHPIDEVKTDKWKLDAFNFLKDSFGDFDLKAFWEVTNKLQIEAVIDHFDMLVDNDGNGNGDGTTQPTTGTN